MKTEVDIGYSGNPMIERVLVNKRLHGIIKHWFDSGSRWYLTQYKKGHKNGLAIEFNYKN